MDAIEMLEQGAREVGEERGQFMAAKQAKATAEDDVLRTIVAAVLPGLPAISSKVEGMYGPLGRAINLGGMDEDAIYLDEQGDFFIIPTKRTSSVKVLDVKEVLDRTSLPAILAVLLTAVRAQAGKLRPRTEEVRRETAILEGIAMAFKIGAVR